MSILRLYQMDDWTMVFIDEEKKVENHSISAIELMGMRQDKNLVISLEVTDPKDEETLEKVSQPRTVAEVEKLIEQYESESKITVTRGEI